MGYVNDRGGYDYVIQDVDNGLYLASMDSNVPEWTQDKYSARSFDSMDDLLDFAAEYGYLDGSGSKVDESRVNVIKIPFLAEEYELEERFYDDYGYLDEDKITDFIEAGGHDESDESDNNDDYYDDEFYDENPF